MKKYRVSIVARTLETYEVEAEDADQAEANWTEGKLVCTDDNLESEILSVEEIKATAQDETAPRPPIIIEVRGGVVEDVLNVPPGIEYEIRDYDSQDEAAGEEKP